MSIYNFDASTDYSGKEMHRMFMDVELPEYVKTAELDDSTELRKLPKAALRILTVDPACGARARLILSL
jgi:hypothetical protein